MVGTIFMFGDYFTSCWCVHVFLASHHILSVGGGGGNLGSYLREVRRGAVSRAQTVLNG